MAKKPKPFPYVKLRQRADGTVRPRFEPGPRERAIGYKAEDLKHSDGGWFTGPEAAAWAQARLAEIKAARASGKRPAPAALPTVRGRTVADLLDDYEASPKFKRLSPRTQRDYRGKAEAIRWQPRDGKHADRVPEVFAQAPAIAVTPANVSAFFEYLVEQRGLPMAAGTIRVLSAAYSWARLSPRWETHVPAVNPCRELGMPTPKPRLVIWTVQEIRALVAAADAAQAWSVGDAVMIALLSGQRQGDVLRLVDRAGARSIADRTAAGEPIAVRQGKTGARVSVFAAPELVARLAAAEARRKARAVETVGDAPIVMREATGQAWDEHAFRKAFAAARTAVGVEGKRYQDLRDTAVTWLARAGCTIPEICAITGHSLQSATSILKHYLELGEPMALAAHRKLVSWMEREGMEL